MCKCSHLMMLVCFGSFAVMAAIAQQITVASEPQAAAPLQAEINRARDRHAVR